MAGTLYSKRLGMLTPAQFQAALDRFDLGLFVRAEAIPFGISKQNVFLTSTKGEYVLRGNSHYAWQYPTEQFFAQQLHEHTCVPVPWPYLVDLSEDIFGWHYALMPRMPGLQLADQRVRQRLNWEEKSGIARAMGETLAHLQDLTWSRTGRYDVHSDTVQPFDLRRELVWPFPLRETLVLGAQYPVEMMYSERVLARIRYLALCAAGCGDRTTTADLAWIEEVIARAREAFDDAFQPCFVMEDYKEQNVVVERVQGGQHWRVSGVFDLTHAHFGDGEADLSRVLAMYLEENPQLAQEFLRAYLANKVPRPGFFARFPLYMLHDRLIIWEFFQRLGHDFPWDEAMTLREWAEPYTGHILY